MPEEKEELEGTPEESPSDEEEETSQETSQEEQETSQEPDIAETLKEKNRQLYARAKKAEEKAKEMEKRLKEAKPKDWDDPKFITKIAEVGMAFDGLDAKERSRLIEEAKLKGLSVSEARKDEDFVIWQKAYREKVAKNKMPEPSTKQLEDTSSPKAKIERFKSGKMSDKETEEFLRDIGAIRDFRKPSAPQAK